MQLRCNADQLVVLHVHDEIVAEVQVDGADDKLADMKAIVQTPPRWARGLPLGVSGFVAARYKK